MKCERPIRAPAIGTGMTASHGLSLALFAVWSVLAFVTSNFGFGILAVLYGGSFVFQWGRYELHEDRLVVRRLWKTQTYRLEGAWLCRDADGGWLVAGPEGLAALRLEPKYLERFTGALQEQLPVRSRAGLMADLPGAAERGLLDENTFGRAAVALVITGVSHVCLLLIAGYTMTALAAVIHEPLTWSTGTGLLIILAGIGLALLGAATLAVVMAFAVRNGQSVRLTADRLSLRTLLRRRTLRLADVTTLSWHKRGHDFGYVVSTGRRVIRLSPRFSTFSEVVRLIEAQTGMHAAHQPIAFPVETKRPRLSLPAFFGILVSLLCLVVLALAPYVVQAVGWFGIVPVSAAIMLALIFGCLALWLTWSSTWEALFEEDGITVKSSFAQERIEPADIVALQLAGNTIRIALPDKTVHVTTRSLPWPLPVFCDFLRAHYGVPAYPVNESAESEEPLIANDPQPA